MVMALSHQGPEDPALQDLTLQQDLIFIAELTEQTWLNAQSIQLLFLSEKISSSFV